MAHIRLGELLVRTGNLSEEGLARALDEQKKWGGRLGRILREMNLVTEDVLLKALTKQLGLPRADLRAPEIPSAVLASIDAQFAMEHRLCPESYDAKSRTLVIAMEDHLDLPALDHVAAKTGARVKTSLAARGEIDAGLSLLYPNHPAVMPPKEAGEPASGRGITMFETKDFSKEAASVRATEDPKQSSVRMLGTEDFSEAAKQVKDDEGMPKERMKYFTTDDFSDAAKKIRDDD
jgi:Type II secretion system (T2SS), protein E, N-terminal domain